MNKPQTWHELLSTWISDFYKPQDVHLSFMPAYEIQRSYLSRFRQRVVEAISQAMSSQHPISYLQAKQLVWQQVEKELSQQLYAEKS